MSSKAEIAQTMMDAIRQIEAVYPTAKPADRQRLARLHTVFWDQFDVIAGIPPGVDPLQHLTNAFRSASGRIEAIIADVKQFTSNLEKAAALAKALGSLVSVLALA